VGILQVEDRVDQVKLIIGMPWYDGADVTCTARFMDFMMYLGELRDRSMWRKALGHEKFMELIDTLPKLDPDGPDAEACEPTEEDWIRMGELQIGLLDYTRTSLPGKARELICESALQWDADYVLMWDDDMRFEKSMFLRLWRHDKPIVAALAFTAREPYNPVIMTIRETRDKVTAQRMMVSDFVLDYPKNQLIGNKEVDGALAFGTGVFLCNTDVFRQIPQPWFESTGAGEDFFFCYKCEEHGVARYVDTATKTRHKQWDSTFIDEDYYEAFRKLNPKIYEERFPNAMVEGKA
tara:strand:+ start:2515 stop:3396 length:882 start_codon:yes stop_codon:yes gene_type:complete